MKTCIVFTAERIEVGDTVSVNFNNAQTTLCSNAVVVYVPLSSGDSWIFQDKDNSQLHYVSEGCTITKKMTPGFPKFKSVTSTVYPEFDPQLDII